MTEMPSSADAHKDIAPARSRITRVRRRWGRWLAGAAVVLYAMGALTGWLLLRYAGHQREVRLVDVAFLRWQAVRQSVAKQQFAEAREEWKRQDFRAAHMRFNSALRRDPGNLEGRLEAADFLKQAGAIDLEIEILENGLAHTPDEPRLVPRLFALLTSTGRDQHALDLLQRQYGMNFAGRSQSLWLEAYAVLASRNVRGPAAGLELLSRYPHLRQEASTGGVVSSVLWDAGETLPAVELLQQYIAAGTPASTAYFVLAGWYEALGRIDDAVRTAEAAKERFPTDIGARVLFVEMLSLWPFGAERWSQQTGVLLSDFRGDPAALHLLARAAGKRGWLELSWGLYELGASRNVGASQLGLYFADALAFRARYAEAWQIMTDIEAQSSSAAPAFMIQLRQRQVMAAASMGNNENVREYARRLAEQVRGDVGSMELCRRLFNKLGLEIAAAEFAPAGERNARSRATADGVDVLPSQADGNTGS